MKQRRAATEWSMKALSPRRIIIVLMGFDWFSWGLRPVSAPVSPKSKPHLLVQLARQAGNDAEDQLPALDLPVLEQNLAKRIARIDAPQDFKRLKPDLKGVYSYSYKPDLKGVII